MNNKAPEIHLSFSGGGFRAAAFCLGVFAYLVDTKRQSSIRSITSVSGGSFLNAYLAKRLHLSSAGEDDIRRTLVSFGSRLAFNTGFTCSRAISIYRLSLAASTILTLTTLPGLVFWLLNRDPIWGALSALGFTSFLCLLVLLSYRNRFFVELIDGTFSIGANWRPVQSKNFPASDCDHIICASDLGTGYPVFFSSVGVFSVPFGYSTKAIQLREAVAISAAFPVMTKPFFFTSQDLEFKNSCNHQASLFLVDGGVINNLGTQWWDPIQGGGRPANSSSIVLVADASTRIAPWRQLRLCPFGFVRVLTRIFSLIYSNSVRPRFDFYRFNIRPHGPKYLGAALSQDLSSLLAVYSARRAHSQSEVLTRKLALSCGSMKELAERNQNIPTTISPLGADSTIDLAYQGYLAAMVEFSSLDSEYSAVPSVEFKSWFNVEAMLKDRES